MNNTTGGSYRPSWETCKPTEADWLARCESAEAEVVALRVERDQLRTALEFYADEENYHEPATVTARPVLFDRGERARVALAAVPQETPDHD